MDIVKVAWSGGKDSTTAVYKHLERGDKVKVVYYIPMLTKEIPLLLKEHYEFILKMVDRFEKFGAEMHRAESITYYEYVTHIATKGKFKGLPFGFPTIKKGQCGFKRDGKEKAVAKCDVGDYDYLSIGIEYDEVNRQNQLSEEKRSILVEEKLTKDDCVAFCKEKDAYSPQYSLTKRDGCALCPFAPKEEREQYFRDYPEAKEIVLYLQKFVAERRDDRRPLKHHKWFIEMES